MRDSLDAAVAATDKILQSYTKPC